MRGPFLYEQKKTSDKTPHYEETSEAAAAAQSEELLMKRLSMLGRVQATSTAKREAAERPEVPEA